MERTATILNAADGVPDPGALGPELEQHGIDSLTILRTGGRVIVHGEAPERAALGALLGGSPTLHEEIFAWQVEPASDRVERTALVLQLKEGEEEAYRRWLEDPSVLDTLVTLWNRNRIWRHDVLLAGTSIVAFYECEDKHNVLKAFREPEALEMLLKDLSKILVLDPYTPMVPFDEVVHLTAQRIGHEA